MGVLVAVEAAVAYRESTATGPPGNHWIGERTEIVQKVGNNRVVARIDIEGDTDTVVVVEEGAAMGAASTLITSEEGDTLQSVNTDATTHAHTDTQI